MVDYERAVAKKKKALFKELFQLLPPKPVILEVGIGSFPNALYLGSSDAPPEMDIVGVDPNEFMKQYALENAKKAGILTPERGNSLRLVRGIAERLPVADQSADAVVCTLTLCSVKNPQKALSEIRRALKPRSGKYLFVEHVLSETNPFFATAQRLATPEHVQAADGCHFDRQTLQTIQEAGFAEVKGDYFELDNCGFLNPTVAAVGESQVRCYMNIGEERAQQAADGDAEVLKDLRLYEPNPENVYNAQSASRSQWSFLIDVVKEHVADQEAALKAQEKAQRSSSGSSGSSNSGQMPPVQEPPTPSAGNKASILLLAVVFGIIGLATMFLMRKEKEEQERRKAKKEKKKHH
ncbi:Methyltransferase-like protein 7A (Protein AAM-B) [Durusdinium trenchii]|uniref:Methyltransferase-like protein 7A (Protein AAM-B) n=1 Tax=Durusdinium trenchii TaxID=1381693 RepID=A0ABP0KPR6_9DINO